MGTAGVGRPTMAVAAAFSTSRYVVTSASIGSGRGIMLVGLVSVMSLEIDGYLRIQIKQ